MDAIKRTRRVGLTEEGSRQLVQRCGTALVVSRGVEEKVEIVNDTFTRLFGYTMEDMPDVAHWWPLAYPDEAYRETVKAEWRRRVAKAVADQSEIEPIEAKVCCKDGSERYVEFHFSSIGDTNLVSFVDLTERKRAEIALRESEERFRLMADTAPVLMWMSGTDKLCSYFNKSWLNFTGRTMEQELGNGWAQGVHSDDLPRCLDTYRQSFDRRVEFNMEYRLRHHDGEYHWIFDTGAPRFNQDGSFAGYIGALVDISERKNAEDALWAANRKLIYAQEQERSRIGRELHDDITQRLAMLAIELEELQENPAEVASRVQELLRKTREISGEVQALSHELHSSKLEYLGVVAGMKSWCKEFAERWKMDVDFRSDVGRVLSLDVGRPLFRILQEALHNAFKHSGVKRIEVLLREDSDEIHLIVSDSGSGFDVEAALQGKGLGLTSIRERVRLVNGTVAIESKPMGGTTIHVCVPLESKQVSEKTP